MFQRLLVPLDGSERAERAIPVAARIARSSGGSITLLRVVPPSIGFTVYLLESPTVTQEIVEAGLAEATQYLARVATFQALEGIKVKTEVCPGIAAAHILSIADANEVDLIVMCSHGYAGLKRWVLGSVAQKVARYSSAPVLILHEYGPVPAGPHPDPSRPLRALVPLDGSILARAALAPAAHLIAALAAPARSALHLTRVVKEPSSAGPFGHHMSTDPMAREQALYKAKGYLRSVTEHLSDSPLAALKLSVTWSVAYDSDVAETLIRVAENGEDAEGAGVPGGCDLIALTTHGRDGLQRWAMGSVTERILVGTKLPILIVRPQEISG